MAYREGSDTQGSSDPIIKPDETTYSRKGSVLRPEVRKRCLEHVREQMKKLGITEQRFAETVGMTFTSFKKVMSPTKPRSTVRDRLVGLRTVFRGLRPFLSDEAISKDGFAGAHASKSTTVSDDGTGRTAGAVGKRGGLIKQRDTGPEHQAFIEKIRSSTVEAVASKIGRHRETVSDWRKNGIPTDQVSHVRSALSGSSQSQKTGRAPATSSRQLPAGSARRNRYEALIDFRASLRVCANMAQEEDMKKELRRHLPLLDELVEDVREGGL